MTLPPLPRYEHITADRAAEMLKHNWGNRPVNRSNVERFKTALGDRSFCATHQGVAFAKSGRLLDGQHRLLAIVETGIPATMLVSYDQPEENFEAIDGGRARSLADRLVLIPGNITDNAHVVQMITAFLRSAVVDSNQVTTEGIRETYNTMPHAWQWAMIKWRNRAKGLTRAAIGAACAIYYFFEPAKAETFVHGLFTGEDLRSGSPVGALRNALLQGKISSNSTANYWKTVAAIKADNEGRQLSYLHEASEDLLGHQQARLLARRAEVRVKGYRNRRIKEERENDEDEGQGAMQRAAAS